MSLFFDSATGFYHWTKGDDLKLSDHFTTTEFTCPCQHSDCQDQVVHSSLLDKLEKVRVALNNPVRVNSGYRCSYYQADLKARGYETATGISQHQLGRAADIESLPNTGAQLEAVASQQFEAIGVGGTWVHVDLRDDKVRRWSYTS